MMALSESILTFLEQLSWTLPLPRGVEVLYPFSDHEVKKVVSAFYRKYYADDCPRIPLIGINPGRFGGGTTGIPFTDPIRLEKDCGIENPWPKRQELSSVFIYDMISAYGGPQTFYRDFYFTSVSPLGFTKDGRNLNYYDDPRLAASLEPFATACLRRQIGWGLRHEAAFCLGGGKNYAYLEKLNERHGFFKRLIPLPHPRYIMQYKLRDKAAHIEDYLTALRKEAVKP